MSLNNRLLLTFSLFVLFASCGYAQDDIILIKKYAESAFKKGDYEYALQNYLHLYNYDKENLDLRYKLGVCYTESNVDKEKAVEHLEYVVSFNNYPIRTKYYLGKAYMYNYRFTEAIEAFYEYKMVGVDENDLLECDRMIVMCEYADISTNFPVNVKFAILDTAINSKYDDVLPVVTPDNLLLYFSSNRRYIDEYDANVFCGQYSETKKGVWQNAVQIPISSYDDENVVGVSSDGNKVLVHANGEYANNDIKIYNRKGVKFTKALAAELPADLNTDDVEMGACFSPDGNAVYFASDRPGGRGGLDLYVSRKGSDGKWGPAENLGSTINTEYDENYPSWRPDGTYFYFASKGHDSFGGYDIQRAFFDEKTGTFGMVQNLGFPINTPLDNTKITYSADGKTAYIAAKRKEGVGNLDIYRLDFGDENIQPTPIGITVMVGGSESSSVMHNETMPKAYGVVYDVYGNVVFQKDVEDGFIWGALYEGDYVLEVKFRGKDKNTGISEKIHVNQGDETIEKIVLLKP